MKILPVPPIEPEVENQVRALLTIGTSFPKVIRIMRSLGLNKIESMKLLRNYGGMPLGKAKDLVHLTEAWADCLEADEAFHEIAEKAARQTGFVENEINVTT